MENLNIQIWFDIFARCQNNAFANLAMSSLTIFEMMKDEQFFSTLCLKYGIRMPKYIRFDTSTNDCFAAFQRWKEIQLHFKKKQLWVRRIDSGSFPHTIEDDSALVQHSEFCALMSLEDGRFALLYLETCGIQKRWTVRFATTKMESFISERFAMNPTALNLAILNKDSTQFFPQEQYSIPFEQGDVLHDLLIQRNGFQYQWWNGSQLINVRVSNPLYTFSMDWNDNCFELHQYEHNKLYEFEPYLHVLGPLLPITHGQLCHPFVFLQPPRSNYHLLFQWA